jgi:hypothetical protein
MLVTANIGNIRAQTVRWRARMSRADYPGSRLAANPPDWREPRWRARMSHGPDDRYRAASRNRPPDDRYSSSFPRPSPGWSLQQQLPTTIPRMVVTAAASHDHPPDGRYSCFS